MLPLTLAWLLWVEDKRFRWVSGMLSSPVELVSYSRSTTNLIRRFLLPCWKNTQIICRYTSETESERVNSCSLKKHFTVTSSGLKFSVCRTCDHTGPQPQYISTVEVRTLTTRGRDFHLLLYLLRCKDQEMYKIKAALSPTLQTHYTAKTGQCSSVILILNINPHIGCNSS